MKLAKRKGFEDVSIRTVWNDNLTAVLGVVGTVGDMLALNLLKYCSEPHDNWVFISAKNPEEARFATTREGALMS